MAKKWRTESDRQAFYLSKKVDEAIRDHTMISEGDRVLVGLSGGKDSLSLLRLLNYRRTHCRERYELVAAHVMGDARGQTDSPPDALARWVESEGTELHLRDISLPEDEPLPMDCERCSRNRRRTLFEMARDLECNKVALGHNLEDFAHTALMNLLSFGRLETMEFTRSYFGGLFTVVRPLAYLRENDLIRFAKTGGLPVVESTCPMAGISRRRAARELMHVVSRDFRHAAMNIVRAAGKYVPQTDEEQP